jgi:hypothetical protein
MFDMLVEAMADSTDDHDDAHAIAYLIYSTVQLCVTRYCAVMLTRSKLTDSLKINSELISSRQSQVIEKYADAAADQMLKAMPDDVVRNDEGQTMLQNMRVLDNADHGASQTPLRSSVYIVPIDDISISNSVWLISVINLLPSQGEPIGLEFLLKKGFLKEVKNSTRLGLGKLTFRRHAVAISGLLRSLLTHSKPTCGRLKHLYVITVY